MRRLLFAFTLVTLGAIGAGCSSPEPLGFAVALTLDFDGSIDGAALATVTHLGIHASGDENYTDTLALGRSAKRTERLVYRPLPTTRNLTLQVHALDDAGDLIGSGVRADIALLPGKTTPVELILLRAEGDGDLGVDGSESPDGGELHDLATPQDLAVNYPELVLESHPLAYYRLDETSGTVAHDSSGNGLDGTYGAGVTHTSGLVGGAIGAAAFSGGGWAATSIIQVARNAMLEPATAVTVECWVMPADDGATVTTPFVSYGPDVTPYEPYILQRASGLPTSYFSTGGVESSETGATSLAANTVYYLAATYDGTIAKLYVNGVFVNQNIQSGALSHYSATVGLGIGSSYANQTSTNSVFNGVIDEVAIYGVALSQAQILHHYKVGSGN